MLRFSECRRRSRLVSHFLSLVFLAGVVDVSVSAEAITSDISCNNEIVTVPERGRIDLVKKPLIVKVGFRQRDPPSRTLFYVQQ